MGSLQVTRRAENESLPAAYVAAQKPAFTPMVPAIPGWPAHPATTAAASAINHNFRGMALIEIDDTSRDSVHALDPDEDAVVCHVCTGHKRGAEHAVGEFSSEIPAQRRRTVVHANYPTRFPH
jgi:hypothetical protein